MLLLFFNLENVSLLDKTGTWIYIWNWNWGHCLLFSNHWFIQPMCTWQWVILRRSVHLKRAFYHYIKCLLFDSDADEGHTFSKLKLSGIVKGISIKVCYIHDKNKRNAWAVEAFESDLKPHSHYLKATIQMVMQIEKVDLCRSV